ncbi:MAG: metallophosphoesterase [Methylococcaceae bacterium]
MTVLIGKKHQDLLTWLKNEWLKKGSPICCIEGFSGSGKTTISRNLIEQLKSDKKLIQILVSVPEESTNIISDLLLDIATELDIQDIHDMAEAIDEGTDLIIAFKRVLFKYPLLLIIDEFQNTFSKEHNSPAKEFADVLQQLANSTHIKGRLLLLTNRSLEKGRWLEYFDIKALPNLPHKDAEKLLNQLLLENNQQHEIASERRYDVVTWLGGNPRAIKVLVSALRYDSLDDLIGLQPQSWELRDRKVSAELLSKLEKAFLGRILNKISNPALTFLYRLAVYRKAFKLEAMEYSATNKTDMYRLRDELMDAFLIEREQEYYVLQSLVRETALHQYKKLTPKELKVAHDLASTYYTRHFEAKQIVNSGKLAGYFVEARYHLVYAEKYAELKTLVILFEKYLRIDFNATAPIPSNDYELNERIILISALLEHGNSKSLEFYLARLLKVRNAQGDFEQALIRARHALTVTSNSDWIFCITLTQLVQGIKAAIETAKEAIQHLTIDEKSADLYIVYYKLLINDNQFSQAIELLRQGIVLIPANKGVFKLYQACAKLLAQDNKPKEAIALLQHSIEVIPANSRIYKTCAGLLVRDNQLKEAIILLQQGIVTIPAYKNIGVLYQACAGLLEQDNQLKEAIILLRQGIAVIPVDKDVRVLYQACAKLLVQDNQLKEAIALLRQGIAVIPVNKDVRVLYQACAELLVQYNHVTEAITLLRQGITMIPDDKGLVHLYQAYAELLVQDNQLKEAITLLQQGIAVIPADKALVHLYQACAELLVQDNQLKEAITLLQQGIAVIPVDKDAHVLYRTCAKLLVQDNQLKEAITLLQQGIIVIPVDKGREALINLYIYYILITKDRLAIEELISNQALSTWQRGLTQALLYQYDNNWDKALIAIRQAQQQTSLRTIRLLEQEVFILLCLGNIETAQQILLQWEESRFNKRLYWLQAWINLRKGNSQQALYSINHYLDSPVDNMSVTEQFLLHLWDDNKALVENPLPLLFPILPPALTGLSENVSRLPNDPPIFNSVAHNIMPKTNNNPEELYLLHLSDIHLSHQNEAIIYLTQLKTDLLNELHIKQIDYLIISGDIANRATLEEYQAARFFVEGLMKQFAIQAEKVIISAGNHDVNYVLSREEAYEFKHAKPNGLLDANYYQEGNVFLIRKEDAYQQRFKYFNEAFYYPITHKNFPLNCNEQAILHSDPENKLLFLALNSAWEIDHYYEKRSSIYNVALAKALNEILEGDYQDWLKIAVWHHPVTGKEAMNAEFLDQLATNGFKICMHGHIHEAKSELFGYDVNRDIRIIAAGTFGASTREQVASIPWQYNLLKWHKKEANITVQTRKKEKLDGAWKADARWGDSNYPSSSYVIELFKK